MSDEQGGKLMLLLVALSGASLLKTSPLTPLAFCIPGMILRSSVDSRKHLKKGDYPHYCTETPVTFGDSRPPSLANPMPCQKILRAKR